MRRLLFVYVSLPAASIWLAGCTDSTPTAMSEVETPSASTPAAVELTPAPSRLVEEFDCAHLDEVFVRFSSPGFLDGSRVGLYVNYTGLPPGEKLLRIWWDHENAFDATEDVRLDEASVDRVDGRLVFESVFEHVYAPVTEETGRKVRAELILMRRTGNCARNRHIVLRPAGRTTEDEGRRACEGGPCRVFVTSVRYGGDLGGLAGGDAKCQDRAAAAGVPGRFRAWLSDAVASPATRFTRSDGPYVLLDGTRIAEGWRDLVSGALSRHIDVTELGTAAAGVSTVWTRTSPDGTAASFGLGPDCEGWTNASSGMFGTNGQHEGKLTLWSFIGASSCNAALRLYCFQQ